MTQTGYFIIADITGYTFFLTQSELDHAQDILKSLFNVLLDNIKPPLIISNFQGDAILSYTPSQVITDGSNLLDAVEQIYCAFAGSLEAMQRNTTCTCQACANIPKLDLKLFVHHGEYLIQEMQGRQELSGPDVILIHRMMKNDVVEKTGVKAYALITQQAIDVLQLGEAAAEMISHHETYEHIGDVATYVHDLRQVWQRERERRRVKISDEEAVLITTVDIPLPPPLAWQFLTRPDIKAIYQDSKSVTIKKRTGGRTGLGTQYHCVHGDHNVVDQFILDWRPYEYFTMREEIHTGPLSPVITSCFTFLPTDTGTRLEFRMTQPRDSNLILNAIGQVLWRLVIKSSLEKRFGPELAIKLRERIEADRAAGLLIDTTGDGISDEAVNSSIEAMLSHAHES